MYENSYAAVADGGEQRIITLIQLSVCLCVFAVWDVHMGCKVFPMGTRVESESLLEVRAEGGVFIRVAYVIFSIFMRNAPPFTYVPWPSIPDPNPITHIPI